MLFFILLFFFNSTQAEPNQNDCQAATKVAIRYYSLPRESAEAEGLLFQDGPAPHSAALVSTPVQISHCEIRDGKLYVILTSKVYAVLGTARFDNTSVPSLNDIHLKPLPTERAIQAKGKGLEWTLSSRDTDLRYESPGSIVQTLESAKNNCPKDDFKAPCLRSLQNDILKLNQWNTEQALTPPDLDKTYCEVDSGAFRLGINLGDPRVLSHEASDANPSSRKETLSVKLKDGSHLVYETGGCMNGIWTSLKWSDIPDQAPLVPAKAKIWLESKLKQVPFNDDGKKAFESALQDPNTCRPSVTWLSAQKSEFSLNCFHSL